jgi:hypothetical protein
MKSPRNTDRTTSSRRRAAVLAAGMALGVALGIGGIQAVLAWGSSSTEARRAPAATPRTDRDRTTSPTVGTDAPTPEPSPSPSPVPDDTPLADGVYPTFIRVVDVDAATVTVDVLQAFFGGAAHRAAIEDGVAWEDVRYNPVYLRNENPLLRTLPVEPDGVITFIGGCDFPSRRVGLIKLRRETTPFNEGMYYDLTVVGGRVVNVQQQIAIAGC